jgi:kynureninase
MTVGSREEAEALDAADSLAEFRQRFALPRRAGGGPDPVDEEIYLVGNSLGAMPLAAKDHVVAELDRWAALGVRGHFEGETEWAPFHRLLTAPMARVVGGRDHEVVVMNSLTVNLHLLMVSFYRPDPARHKVLIESHAFPSDHFAVESQVRQRGLDPEQSVVTISPRVGEETLRPSDIIAAIEDLGDELALVLFPGVQYYTGQVFDMSAITAAAHGVGAKVGFDLAHAAGNIELDLHGWDVDFAAWCTYKYLNSGPGGVAGCFVHERHVADQDIPKFLGWWGTNPDTRFEMATTFDPVLTADSWQLSNAPILAMAALRASLEIFDEAGGISALRRKSEQQIGYFDDLLEARLGGRIESLTPRLLAERGCQFALRVVGGSLEGRELFEQLEGAGVACDWRHPDVLRVAPVPLYNSFLDIYRFVELLDELTA